MANLDHPSGFRFYRDLTSGDQPQVRHFDVTASTELFRGQPVKLHQTTGDLIAIVGTFTSDDGVAGSMVGIANEYLASQATIKQDFPVILAHNAEFIIQDDAGVGTEVTTRALFKSTFLNDVWYSITNFASGNSTLGFSTAELAGATSAAILEYLKVTDWNRAADNAFGHNMDLIVRFNPNLFSAGPYASETPE